MSAKQAGAAPPRPEPRGEQPELARRVVSGEARAVARLISGLEDGDPAAAAALAALRGSRGRAHVVGVTGPPGSGKSTLCDKMIAELRGRGLRVGILAVDPSSPFSGGAILGDRLRMQRHALDEGVFIRSLASRGRLGGLSRATAAAARALEAAGYDWVIVETVGVGQSEVEIVKMADTVVLVSVPGLGDDIQVIKAGVMEIGDVFVVNKADREGADRVVREIRGMLEMAAGLAWARAEAAHHGPAPGSAAGSVAGPGAGGLPELPLDAEGHPVLPPILKTVAETGEGCAGLVDAVIEHRRRASESGALASRRLEAARAEMRSLIAYRLLDLLEGERGRGVEDSLARAVASGDQDPYSAAEELLAALSKGAIA
ncbi:MAG TPA: methylmalonyl Co-A mutase-associated GTPase MeaB [Spirochaetales bacterium]|nr:methylmalonyl Co-A mutase-associated GTPase MeaB [Spirochaetales bacterium]HRY55490.1 methylmalonyl Co-A mutase-associated GTPase MeaB [Spirochaetia bacterium]